MNLRTDPEKTAIRQATMIPEPNPALRGLHDPTAEYPALVKLIGSWANRPHPYAVIIGKYAPEEPDLQKWFLKMDDGMVVVASYGDFTRLPSHRTGPTLSNSSISTRSAA